MGCLMNEHGEMTLQDIEKLIDEGQSESALQMIASLESDDSSLSVESKMRVTYLKVRALLDCGKLDEALDLSNRLIEKLRKADLPLLMIGTLQLQAEIWNVKSELERASSKIEQGMQLLERHGDDLSLDDFKYLKGLLLMTEASILSKQGHVERALARYLESETLFKESKRDSRRKRSLLLMNIGTAHYWMARHDQALDYFRKSLELARQVHMTDVVAMLLTNIGLVYLEKKDVESALSCFNESERQFLALNRERERAVVLMNLSMAYQQLGRFDEALRTLEVALQIKEKFNDEEGIARVHANLGQVHGMLGNYEQSLYHSKKCVKFFLKRGQKIEAASVLNNFGSILLEVGKINEAQQILTQALNLARESNHLTTEAVALHNLGMVAWYRGKKETALDHLEKSLSIRKKINDVEKVAKDLFTLVIVKIGSNDDDLFENAREHLKELQHLHEHHDLTKVPIIAQYYQAARACLLKETCLKNDFKGTFAELSVFFAQLQESFEILERLFNDTILDFDIYIAVAINLLELYLIQLRLRRDVSFVNEVIQVLDAVSKKSRESGSIVLHVHSCLLVSKLYLFLKNHREALKWALKAKDQVIKHDMTVLRPLVNETLTLIKKIGASASDVSNDADQVPSTIDDFPFTSILHSLRILKSGHLLAEDQSLSLAPVGMTSSWKLLEGFLTFLNHEPAIWNLKELLLLLFIAFRSKDHADSLVPRTRIDAILGKHLPKSTITSLLERLTEKGYVVERLGKDMHRDRRTKYYGLTKKGKALLKAFMDLPFV